MDRSFPADASPLPPAGGRTLGLPATLDVPLSWLSSVVGAGLSRPISSGDVFLIARIDRIAAIPRPAVVALAAVVNDRVVTQSVPGLPGLVRGGRYVLYRANLVRAAP